jgi:orotate phosphoribosyltransferase-like protein
VYLICNKIIFQKQTEVVVVVAVAAKVLPVASVVAIINTDVAYTLYMLITHTETEKQAQSDSIL